MSQQRHLIARTVLELETGDLADVWRLQEEASRLFYQQVVPELERLFDRLVEIDQVVRLDRVVVEVGAVDQRFLADEFVPNLLTRLNQTLSDTLQNVGVNEQIVLSKHSRSGADWEVLLYFLQYGRLPWWITVGNWQNWFSRWEAVMQSSANWQIPLQRLLVTSTAAQQRLVEQFPDSFRHQLIVRLQPTWVGWLTLLAQAQQLMQALRLSSSKIQQLERHAWRLLLAEMTPEYMPANLPATRWMRNWLTQLVQTENTPQSVLRASLETVSSSESDLWRTAIAQVFPTPPDQPDSDLALWLFFLEQGRLPQGQVSQDWFSRWEGVMQRDTQWQQSLLAVLAANPTARQRFVNQFPESFRHQFVVQLQPMWIDWYALLDQARRVMQAVNLGSSETQHLETQAWLLLFSEMVTGCESLSPLPTATWIRNWLIQLVQIAPPQLLRDCLEATAIEERSLWLRELDQVLSQSTIREVRDRAPSSSEEQESGIYVTQAGLVLLHPFLSFYFAAIDLLEGDSFRSEAAQQTAIYLLYYLATKQTDVPEYELVLPKLLCGWSLDEPVVRGMELSIAALQEGEHLLQTVIDYWEVLKSTSPDGLREGFLQRNGKLTRNHDGNWTLQVEQSSIDVLLSSLPWGLSMVKLPWMQDLLTVEWT